jgi:thioredoxin reductase
MAAAARGAGARLESKATAIGFFPEDGDGNDHGHADADADGESGLLAVVTPAGLRRVVARRYVYATGSYDQNLPFADNDRPGIVSARACGRLAFHHGVRPVPPGKRVLVLAASEAAGAAALVNALAADGIDAELVDVAEADSASSDGGAPAGARVVGVRGIQAVRAVEIESMGKARGSRVIATDLVAVAALPAPASELARQHGAEVGFDPARGGFAVVVDAGFRTRAPGVYACGDVTGFAGAEAAARAGEAAGRAIAADLGAESAP